MELFLDAARLDAYVAFLKAGLSQEFSFTQTEFPQFSETVNLAIGIADELVDGMSDLHRYWPLTVTVDTDDRELTIRSAMARAWYRKLHYNLSPSLLFDECGNRLNTSRLILACEDLLPCLEVANIGRGPIFAGPRREAGESHPSFLAAVSDYASRHYERSMPSLYWNERWRQPGIDPQPELTEAQVDEEFLEFVRTCGWDFRHKPQPKIDDAGSTPELTVDIGRRTLTFRGTTHTVNSEAALRYVRILFQNPGVYIKSKELADIDKDLIDPRADKHKKALPGDVLKCIESNRRLGSRWTQ